jgi:L-fuconolactonase
MRVDSHQHFWRYSVAHYPWIDDSLSALRRDFLPEELGTELQTVGIDVCIAVQATQIVYETRWLLELAERHPFVAGVIGWVDLQADDAAAHIEQLAGYPKFLGVRHIVQSEPDDRFLLRPAFCRGVSLLADFDLTYDILIYPRHLPAAVEFVSRFDDQRFVLDHLAKPEIRLHQLEPWADWLREIARFPNVYCKLSGLVTEADWRHWTASDLEPYLDVAFDCFGPGRLMFGSDWPVCTVAASYQRVTAVVDDYLSRRSADDRDRVMGENAARVWRKLGELP